MKKLTAALTAAAGFAVGVLTLRSLRERRRTPREEAVEATRDALAEAGMAAEHAAAAADHARVAGEKAVETAHEELPGTDASEPPAEASGDRGRLRRAGKGWIRR